MWLPGQADPQESIGPRVYKCIWQWCVMSHVCRSCPTRHHSLQGGQKTVHLVYSYFWRFFFQGNTETAVWFPFLKSNFASISLQYLHARIVPCSPNQNDILLFKITLATQGLRQQSLSEFTPVTLLPVWFANFEHVAHTDTFGCRPPKGHPCPWSTPLCWEVHLWRATGSWHWTGWTQAAARQLPQIDLDWSED